MIQDSTVIKPYYQIFMTKNNMYKYAVRYKCVVTIIAEYLTPPWPKAIKNTFEGDQVVAECLLLVLTLPVRSFV